MTGGEHPRIAARAGEGPPTSRESHLRRGGVVGGFNARVGLRITTMVGTMWAAYLFAAVALVSLPLAVLSGDLIVIVAWLAQTFLQLVLLPVIMVGQNVQAKAGDARAQATFDDVSVLIEQQRQILVLLSQRCR